MKHVTMGGGGVKNCPKLRDNVYGRPLRPKVGNTSWLVGHIGNNYVTRETVKVA